MAKILAFLGNESAATSIEYAIMASCIALAIIATITGLGSKVAGQYTSVSTALK